jgi:UV DNA damage repair endonuclease
MSSSVMLRRVALVRTVFNRVNRVLARHNKSVGLPHMKLSSLLRPVKDHLGLRTYGVYRIPRQCGSVYIGQTGRSVDIRLKEHQRHVRLEHPDKSAVAEHSIDQGHRIQFHNSSILATKTRYIFFILFLISNQNVHSVS